MNWYDTSTGMGRLNRCSRQREKGAILMRKLVIEKAAVKHNLSVIKERAAGAVIYGVLTGDGGGAGVAPMARLLRAEGIGRFAVCCHLPLLLQNHLSSSYPKIPRRPLYAPSFH